MQLNDSRTAYIGCGLRGWGLLRTEDAGEHIDRVGFDAVRAWDVAFDPTDSDTIYVGTEPPALHVSDDRTA